VQLKSMNANHRLVNTAAIAWIWWAIFSVTVQLAFREVCAKRTLTTAPVNPAKMEEHA